MQAWLWTWSQVSSSYPVLSNFWATQSHYSTVLFIPTYIYPSPTPCHAYQVTGNGSGWNRQQSLYSSNLQPTVVKAGRQIREILSAVSGRQKHSCEGVLGDRVAVLTPCSQEIHRVAWLQGYQERQEAGKHSWENSLLQEQQEFRSRPGWRVHGTAGSRCPYCTDGHVRGLAGTSNAVNSNTMLSTLPSGGPSLCFWVTCFQKSLEWEAKSKTAWYQRRGKSLL